MTSLATARMRQSGEGLIGKPVLRREDDRLLRGEGRFIEDMRLEGMLQALVLRSDHAHAELRGLDVETARGMPGVVAVYKGADLLSAGLRPLPCVRPIESVDGRPFAPPARHALALERVRHVGEPVALIVAETLNQALDAAETIVVDCQPLPAVVDPSQSQEFAFIWERGDAVAVARTLERARHVVECRVTNSRVFMAPIETRGAIGKYDPASNSYLLYSPSQGAHLIRRLVALSLGIAEDRLRVVTEDVGGSFGLKLVNHPEQTLVLFAARELGRPVRWIASRSESFLSDNAGRDHRSLAVAGFDESGRFLALKVETIANLGAYASALSPTTHTAGFAATLGGAYAIPIMHVRSTGVLTNMAPTDAYRGSGKPESVYLTERLMDRAARAMDIDRLELRRRNLVTPAAMPYKAATGYLIDSADFPAILDQAASSAGWESFPARRAEAATRGRRRGIGISFYIHTTGVTSSEISRVTLEASGRIAVRTGLQSSGQGHDTALAQLVADRFELPMAMVEILQGDTGTLGATGGPTAGSSSLQVGGVTILRAAEKMLEVTREAAGVALEAAARDIEYRRGRFVIRGTDRSIDFAGLARRRAHEGLPSCAGEAALEGQILTVPNGAYVAEVEIDEETGSTRLCRLVGVNDLGRRLNPLIVDGQLHGALAQGVGQALLERVVYDPATAQLLTGSLMDYGLPRADDLPAFELHAADLPTANNPLGMKGAAEVGCIGAPAAVINALVDALNGLDFDMPATPEAIWRALNRRPDP